MAYFVEDEIAAQPECWERAQRLAPEVGHRLGQPGERVAFVGCGTSWFVGQVLAYSREARGLGECDAATASELLARPYDRVVAITRSGTTTEVVDLLRRLSGRVSTVAVVGDPAAPAAEAADDVVDLSFADEQSVVQTRFATTTLVLARAVLGEDVDPLVEVARQAVTAPLDASLVAAEQSTFLGRGWTVGLAHEAALKFRETSSAWTESYPAMDYRHGPISVAAAGRAVWMFGEPPAGLAQEVRATGARFVTDDRDPLVQLVTAQRVAVARAVSLGLNPDQPRSLSRSVVLAG